MAAKEAADMAVREVFALIGIDVDKPEQVEEFRKDLRFGQTLRQLAEKGTFAFISAILLAFGGAIAAVVLDYIKLPH